MKNLKKVLSLVLALAMAMSLMTTAFATEDFGDADKINNTEAVEVMAALGVLEGSNGNFDPAGTLTREQGAKIIAYMVLGADAAEELTVASAPFADVKADRWSAPYIAWAVQEGILNGVGNNKFNPTGALTELAFAKMCLTALGYDAGIEGLTGDSWGINTSKLAVSVELNKGIGALSATKAMAREDAAQMAFNTLTATLVSYTGGVDVSTGDTTITIGATRGELAQGSYNNYDLDNAVADLQFAEKYFPNLMKSTAAGTADDYNRPAAYAWVIDENDNHTYQATDTVIYTVMETPDYTVTIDTDNAKAAVANVSDLSANVNKILNITKAANKLIYDGSSKMYVNGSVDVPWANTYFNAGDVVEIYANDTDLTIDAIVVVRESAAQITDVTANTGKATTTIDGDKVVYNYNIFIDTNMDGTYDIRTNDLDLAGYDKATYVKDAYLTINQVLGGTTILDTAIATVNTGAITAFNDGKTATMNGTKYEMANASIPGHSTSVDFKTGEYALVMSSTGYVLAVETVEAAAATLSDVVYANGTVWAEAETSYGTTKYNVYAQVVGLDGTVSNLMVGQYKIAASNGTNFDYEAICDGVSATVIDITGTYDDSHSEALALTLAAGFYTVSDVAATSSVPAYKSLSTDLPDGYDKDTAADSSATFDSKLTKFDTKYLTNSTVYTIIKGEANTIKVANFVGAPNYAASSNDIVYIYKTANDEIVNLFVTDAADITLTNADVLYVSAATATKNGTSTYEQANVYDMAGNKLAAITVASGSKDTTGFVTYTVTDGVYTLTDASTAFVGADTDWSTSIGAKYYKNVTFVESNFYADRFDVTASSKTLADIPAADVVVVDVRPSSDAYNGAIASLAELVACSNTLIEAGTYYFDVQGNLYMDKDGAAVFFVTGTTTSSRAAS